MLDQFFWTKSNIINKSIYSIEINTLNSEIKLNINHQSV